MNNNYRSPYPDLWKGRHTNEGLPPEYWHEHISMLDLNSELKEGSESNKHIALLGYACDEGVKRNLGRIGAKKAADEIRKQLSKLAVHFDDKKLWDAGNIVCDDGDLEATQQALQKAVSVLLKQEIFPVVIGGGHDIAYGHFSGIYDYLKIHKPGSTIGIINFDAHFDLRVPVKEGNSGTPFYQISEVLKSEKLPFHYLVLGIQRESNGKELFNRAKHLGVDYVLSEECRLNNIEKVKNKLRNFITNTDYIYLSIDMDGFASNYAPGVSAPSPMGFDPAFAFELIATIFDSNKVISCDIAECNPSYDYDDHTSRLAARLIYHIADYL